MADEIDINENPTPFISADEIADELGEALGDLVSLEELTSEGELIREVEEKFYQAERGKDADEQRWLEAYNNFRGVYGKNVQFRSSEKSRVFVKITKTKVLAAYGQLVDIVLGGSKFPLEIAPTKVPEGIVDKAFLNPLKEMTAGAQPDIEGASASEMDIPAQEEEFNPLAVGFKGDGKKLSPGARFSTEEKFLGGLEEEFTGPEGVVLEPGVAKMPEQVQVNPAMIAARRMEKLIHDQIEESDGSVELRNALFEAALLGHGVIKGPFNYNKTLHRWTRNENGDREYTPEVIRVPRIEYVSLWDFYPDPNASTIRDCEYAIHRHKMNRSQLRDLKRHPYFNSDAIDECIKLGPNYVNKDFETVIKESDHDYISSGERWEVLEYWGTIDRELAEKLNLEIDEHFGESEEIQINAWVCHGNLLRVVINPFMPARIPYLAFPYEKNPYSFFGIGVAENMADSQQVMNGHARMAIDNLALAGNIVFDIDESALVPGQSMEVYGGKIFRRQSGMPGQAVYGVKFPSTAVENLQMFDKFRQLADESTGLPSYAHGQTGVQTTTRTASGMSMLIGAASLNIKTVIKNLDDFFLQPLGEAFFQWNMAFYEGDLAVEGDLEVKATGTSSLIQKEVRSQRLTMFLQTAQNPAIAPFVKLPYIVRELAHSLDLDPEEILNDPDQARIYAEIIGLQKAMEQQQPQAPMQSAGEAPAAPQPVAVPGEEEFSGNMGLPPEGVV